MRYCIWGAGKRGKRILDILGEDKVLAYVEMDEKKINTSCRGKDIISIEDYVREYKSNPLIISFYIDEKAAELAKERGIYNYIRFNDSPSEILDCYNPVNIFDYLSSIVKKEVEYNVYGYTLLGLMTYDFLCERCNSTPCFILDDIESGQTIECLKDNDINIKKKDERADNSISLICKAISAQELESLNVKENIYLYDCTDKIDYYYHSELEQFKNKHIGKRCFIVATGPSIRINDLEKLKENKEICFSMNSIFQCFSDTKWRPAYYVASDPAVQLEYKEELLSLDVDNIFLRDGVDLFWREVNKTNIYCYHEHMTGAYDKLPPFSTDFARKSYGIGTVTYTCLQLAAYMGFKDIYLLGVDFSYKGNSHTHYGHFYKEEKLTSISCDADIIEKAYEAAKLYCEKKGTKIYNATRGGELEVFERVDFDSLF